MKLKANNFERDEQNRKIQHYVSDGYCRIWFWAYSTFFDKPQVVTITEKQPLKYTTLAAGQ